MFTNANTLADASTDLAGRIGSKTAFVFGDSKITFEDLDRSANRVANGLLHLGLKNDDRVALFAKDRIESFEILIGVTKSKKVLVSINWRLALPELTFIINNSGATVAFIGYEFESSIPQLKINCPEVRFWCIVGSNDSSSSEFKTWRDSQLDTLILQEYAPNDVAVQLYTSGTTGSPKGVQLAHRTFFDLIQGMNSQGDEWMGIGQKDILLLSLPSFHIGGLWWAIQGYLAGATCIITDVFIGWKAIELITQHRVSKIAMVPAMLQVILAEPAIHNADLSSVTGVLYGGSPISCNLLLAAKNIFHAEFFQIYGLTETGNMAVCLRPDDHDWKNAKRLQAAGKPLPGVELKVLDDAGNTLPANRSGEIWLKSPSRMIGYWQNETATRETLIDGWIRTGDAGYMDEDGYLFVNDRMKDMIIYAGENLFPAEIETSLLEHPSIAEVAVIGVPDERWGEVPKAFVVLRPGSIATAKDLNRFMRSKVADFKIPKTYHFVESLPRNSSGKILKRQLREQFWKGLERQVN